jgi:hypothetical protein
MDHLQILKRAWNVTWKYRALWLVGLLLVLAGGGVGSGFGSGAPGSGGASSGGGGGGGGVPFEGPEGIPDLSGAWEKVAPIVITVAIVVAGIILLVILLSLVAVFVRYVTRVSLIQMVQGYEETGEEIGFRRGLRLGWSRSAFHLFLINLIVNLPLTVGILLLIGALAVPIILVVRTGLAILPVILMVLLLIPVILLGVLIRIVAVPIIELAFRACVIDGLGAWQAIVEAFGLIRRNLGPAALQWLLLVGLGIAWGIALFVVNLPLVFFALLVAGLPGAAVGGIVTLLSSWPWGLGLGLLIFIPVFILVVALPNIALTTLATVYYSTTWTLTYRELRVIDAGAQEVAGAEAEEEDRDR